MFRLDERLELKFAKHRYVSCWVSAASFLALSNSVSLAQQLPIGEGAYLTKEECNMAEQGELDMVGFSVEKDGRAVGMHESGCLVASIKPVRQGRYHVELDCREFEDIYQYQFFLDVISGENIRVEGEDLWLCRKGFLADIAGDTADRKSDELIEKWEEANEDCRGGFGDDPRTAVACARRDQLANELEKRNLCFGRDGQSRSEYEWHTCTSNSIR